MTRARVPKWMIGKSTGGRVSKWLVVSTFIVLVSVATILQTFSSLGASTSIYATLRNRNTFTNHINFSAVTDNSSIENDFIKRYLEISPIKTPAKRNMSKQKRPENDISSMEASKNNLQQKVTHIGFLKVHKAGSTTMQNIFFRFGLKHNLTFVLPEKGHYFLKTKSAMSVRPGHHRDILACHSIYSRKLFESVLPEDSVNIGIIREPLERMVSAAYYYRDVWKSPSLSKVPRLNFIHNLINRPDRYELKPFSKTKNSMGQDFGFSSLTTINDTEEIEKHIDLLKNDFKQVLVMERFEESLILMKRTLNWDLADVIYLKTNSHAHQPVVLSPKELNKFKTTCFLDYAVFGAFNDLFDKKVRAEGPEFIKEVEHFESVLQQVKDFCDGISLNSPGRPLTIVQSAWNEPFDVTEQDCHYMQMKELKFVELLKRRHRKNNILYDLLLMQQL